MIFFSKSLDVQDLFVASMEVAMDPFVWFLKTILRGFLTAKLTEAEQAFIADNMAKHRKILWLNLVAIVLIALGLHDTQTNAIPTVVSVLIAPVMLLGSAWFNVSFGGIPVKLISIAMATTTWMFSAFLISLSTMFIAGGFILSPYIWPVLVYIYIAVIISCIQYDTADGLKAGLDDASIKHSRAALEFYRKQGITPPGDE